MPSAQVNSPALRTSHADASRHRRCMTVRHMSMRIRRNIRGWTVLAAALVVLAFARAAAADDAAGMRVYRDPATGEFTAPPPEAAVVPESAASGAALGIAPQPLVEEPGSS